MIGTKILFCRKVNSGTVVMLLAGILAGGIMVSTAPAQSPPDQKKASASPGEPLASGTVSPYHADRFAARASKYYSLLWGVDSLSVKAVESGELIRFSYRILDPTKAAVLNEKKNEPALIDPEKQVRLIIPTLEKVGQLRQSNVPEAGRSYWMAFSNPGRPVKRGDRVNIVIGQFHADGLVVE